MKKVIINKKAATKYFETPANMSFKFGYYNYSPMNKAGDKLLAHKINFESRLPKADDVVDVGFFLLPEGKWHKLASTRAFNWQQGAMLQWLGPGYNDEIIFNDTSENNYIARIINIHTGEEQKLPKAIYGIDAKGEYSIAIHFERCNFTRAYSYAGVVDQAWNKKIPEEDGIIKIDLKTGEWHTIIPLKKIVAFDENPEFNNSMHWFEHIIMNPSGNRFAFYHRYTMGEGFATRVFTADTDGKNIWLHPNSPAERLTHLGWINDTKYVLYTLPQSKVNMMWSGTPGKTGKVNRYKNIYRNYIKPFVPKQAARIITKKTSYYALTEDRGHIIDTINPKPGCMDGHPGFTYDGRFMLTDTYADKKGYRHLLLYDMVKNKTIEVAKLFSFYNNCNWRADLHPRFSRDENYIIIDSTHDGYHRMVILKIDWGRVK